jgi:hypothetical protein
MEPTVVVVLIAIFIGIGGIIAGLLKLKNDARSPDRKRIDKVYEERVPEVTIKYKLEDLGSLRTHWKNNGLEFSDMQFEELYKKSIQDENGNFSISKRSVDLKLNFHEKEEQVTIVIDCYYNLGNVMHVHSKNRQLLAAFEKASEHSTQKNGE